MGRVRLLLTVGPVIALAVGVVAPQAGAVSQAGAASRARAGGQARAVPAPARQHAASPAAAGPGRDTPFCRQLGKRYQASAGAQMWCRGAQLHKPTGAHGRALVPAGPGAPGNVDAASVAEDVSPAGVAAQGQSEVSVGAAGRYVVEAWNDATGFLTTCGAPAFKEEGTGLGFSTDGGKTFTDLGGLPNLNCRKYIYEGDPSVAAYRTGGHTYFYISSLYDSLTGEGPSFIAFDACTVTGSGSSATLSCGQPVIAGSSSQCELFKFRTGTHKTRTFEFCSFTDKEFLAVDPARGRMYVTYSDFRLTGNGGDPEVLSACDLGSPGGGRGPAGGTPAAPVCEHGTKLVKVSKRLLTAKPYFVVAKRDKRGCENEGSYPAVDVASGNAFVGYEFNWASSIFLASCARAATPVQDMVAKVPHRCLTLTTTSPCDAPSATAAVPVVSMEAVFVPGYNRFPASDFPRIAVSDKYRTVSLVWNDARFHPFGDVLLQSFHRGTLRAVQARPVVLDRPHGGGLTFMPALRTATAGGLLDVSWYSRPSASTVNTGVTAALGVSPVTTTTPVGTQVTSALSNWLNDSSLIIPNFGDYTDAAVSVTGSPPYLGRALYIAWSDGRLGIPQPFLASVPAK